MTKPAKAAQERNSQNLDTPYPKPGQPVGARILTTGISPNNPECALSQGNINIFHIDNL